jgi:hypothetical protein
VLLVVIPGIEDQRDVRVQFLVLRLELLEAEVSPEVDLQGDLLVVVRLGSVRRC